MPDREFRRVKYRLDQGWYDSQEKGGRQLASMVQARTDRSRKVSWFCHDDDLPLWPGEEVVVETERGTARAVILTVPEKRWVSPKSLRKVLRHMNEGGARQQGEKTGERQERAAALCKELAYRHHIDLKLVEVEYVHWENRTVFYFVAEGRVDFRELVKELSRNLRCRIEMRQIGPRDETKMLGGLGRCGREHCCSTHLTVFRSVRTKMAKEPRLVVNQEKITGHCRKLLCCLAYEREIYSELREEMPALGIRVETPDGPARVVELQVIRQQVKVNLEEAPGTREYPLSAFRPKAGAGDSKEEIQYVVDYKPPPSRKESEFVLPPVAEGKEGSAAEPTDEEESRKSGRGRSSSGGDAPPTS